MKTISLAMLVTISSIAAAQPSSGSGVQPPPRSISNAFNTTNEAGSNSAVLFDEQRSTCLLRTEPGENGEMTIDQVAVERFTPPNGVVTFFGEFNRVCRPADSCFVSIGDQLTVSKRNELTWFKRFGPALAFQMQEIEIVPKRNLTILKGRDVQRKWDLFLIYSGKLECNVYPNQICGHYRFEVHPDGYTDFPKPDEALKPGRIEATFGCTVEQTRQPGGGGGSEPPP